MSIEHRESVQGLRRGFAVIKAFSAESRELTDARRHKNPPVFPAGTTLHMTSYHDNSAANRRNPDPANWTGSGERAVDEMAIAHIDFIYLSPEDCKAATPARVTTSDRPQQ